MTWHALLLPPAAALLSVLAVWGLPACGGDKLALGGGGSSGCVPGTYVGSYTCTTDASFVSTTTSALTLVLQGDRGGPSLAIAPGTTLSSTQAGDLLTSPVSGSLDCTSYELHATTMSTQITSSGAQVATFYEMNPLTARYDPDASPPGLVDGVITVAGLPSGLGGTCTWSAALQP